MRGGPSCTGSLEVKIDSARVTPRALPKRTLTPVSFAGKITISNSDGSHPQALREAVLGIDKDVKIDVSGLSVCGYKKLAGRDTRQIRRACGDAIVGEGVAEFHIAYPENAPIPLPIPVTVVSGGVRAGVTTLFAHAFITVPVPRAVVATIEIRKRGELGLTATVRVPRIAEGYGSLTKASLKLRRFFRLRGKKRSFLSARCPDGVFKLKTPKLLFRNETQAAGTAAQTILKGGLAVPCTSKP